MRFSELAQYLERLEATASRNDMTEILAEIYKKAEQEETAELSYLLLGELVPSYRGLEFQIAEKMMFQVVAETYGVSPAEVARLFRQKGDMGNVAYDLAGARRHAGKEPTVTEVYRRMYAIAQDMGTGSQERKVEALAALMGSLDRISAKYVARIPLGKMRLGFSEATLLDALSFMVAGDKSARGAIEAAFNVTADIGAIAARVKKGGLASLGRVAALPGTPIRPSLAERVAKISDAMEKAGPEVGLEEKLDGLRMQVHAWREGKEMRVMLFSRNLENTTAMFPEIVAAVRRLAVSSIILDGEAIGYYPATDKFAPFQETVQRKRKHDVALFAEKIPVSMFTFDILYLDGKSLLDAPFRERRTILEGVMPRRDDTLRLTSFEVTADPSRIAHALAASIGKGLEGLVAKNLDAAYEPGSRGFHWVKLKATTAALGNLREGGKKGLPDTIDCVVMGAYRGRGKRAAFGVGGFLLGVRGRDGRYYSISRLGTGLSDEVFREAYRRIRTLSVKEIPKEYVVEKETSPDIWIRPALVVEILADEITLSPRHTAGKKGEEGRGYSLRFPRLVRFRDDKKAEDATTDTEVAKMYGIQKKI